MTSNLPAVSLGEQWHDADGCRWDGRPHLGACYDRGTEAGHTLTEIRTVLSRAQTALNALALHCAGGRFGPWEHPRVAKTRHLGWVDAGEPPYAPGGRPFDDPDLEQMRTALQRVVQLLTPWRRTGKTTHWVADVGPTVLVDRRPDELYGFVDGDESTLAALAVLDAVRARLVEQFTYDPQLAAEAAVIVDGLAADTVDQFRGELDDEGGR